MKDAFQCCISVTTHANLIKCVSSPENKKETLCVDTTTQAVPIPFDDDTSVFDTELWDPATGNFTVCPSAQHWLAPEQGQRVGQAPLHGRMLRMKPTTFHWQAAPPRPLFKREPRLSLLRMAVPITLQVLSPIAVGRNYHSVGLLLPDGRVFSGGGGLCGTCTCGPILLEWPATDAGMVSLQVL